MGPQACLTAAVDGNVSGRVLHKAADRLRRRLGPVAKCASEEVDGLTLLEQREKPYLG